LPLGKSADWLSVLLAAGEGNAPNECSERRHYPAIQLSSSPSGTQSETDPRAPALETGKLASSEKIK